MDIFVPLVELARKSPSAYPMGRVATLVSFFATNVQPYPIVSPVCMTFTFETTVFSVSVVWGTKSDFIASDGIAPYKAIPIRTISKAYWG